MKYNFNMLTHTELLEWFDDLSKIIFDTKISIDNIKRITHPKDDFEKHVIKHGFFHHCYFQSRFTIVIQLCKVFDDNSNQKRNFHKLFNRFAFEKYDKDLMNILSGHKGSLHLFSNRNEIVHKIKELRTEIKTNEELIDRIIILRDNLYAHSDPKSSIPNVTNPELEKLIDLAIKVYNNIKGKLYDATLLFEHTTDWKVDYPIKALAKIIKDKLEQYPYNKIKKQA